MDKMFGMLSLLYGQAQLKFNVFGSKSITKPVYTYGQRTLLFIDLCFDLAFAECDRQTHPLLADAIAAQVQRIRAILLRQRY